MTQYNKINEIIKSIVLFLFMFFLIKLQLTNDIEKYINIKYSYLSQISIVLFLILFIFQIKRIFSNMNHHASCDHNHHHNQSRMGYIIIFIPIVAGLLLPSVSLNSAMAIKKQTSQIDNGSNKVSMSFTGGYSQSEESILLEVEKEETLIFNNENYYKYYRMLINYPEKFDNKKIDISGFYFQNNNIDTDHVSISRFLITHCLADASLLDLYFDLNNFNVNSINNIDIQTDKNNMDIQLFKKEYTNNWINIKGKIVIEKINNKLIPVIKPTTIESIDTPFLEYIFP